MPTARTAALDQGHGAAKDQSPAPAHEGFHRCPGSVSHCCLRNKRQQGLNNAESGLKIALRDQNNWPRSRRRSRHPDLNPRHLREQRAPARLASLHRHAPKKWAQIFKPDSPVPCPSQCCSHSPISAVEKTTCTHTDPSHARGQHNFGLGRSTRAAVAAAADEILRSFSRRFDI